ncbi:MAG: hypothetical protein KGQ36_02100 [Rickettsiales bacterium]|nr:hypothetical protein [Rickettsiales bacterium]
MAEKSLVIVNESFPEMVFGKNTTLAYIVAALDLGHEVYIHNLPKIGEIFPSSINSSISAIKINPESEEAKKLIKNYKIKNEELAIHVASAASHGDMMSLQQYDEKTNPHGYKNEKVLSLGDIFLATEITLSDVTNVIQRLEPMKAPFPPEGQESFVEVLHKIKIIFPHLSFNCPIYYENDTPKLIIDKDTPQRINEILKKKGQKEIAVSTREFRLGDNKSVIAKCCKDMSDDYKVLFPDKKNSKIILKPKDSAQSLGVMAIEFCDDDNAYNLEKLQNATHESLKEQQIYKIKSGLDVEEFGKVVETLCYLESLKTNEKNFTEKAKLKISEVSSEEQNEVAKRLYDHEVLAQPFLEGVKSGDIRVNIIKNAEGNFEAFGVTFRRSNRITDDKFTTCLTSGGSSPFPIFLLTKDEQKDLNDKIGLICDLLNDSKEILREKYKNVVEIGADFLLHGNGKNVFLGEMNHHCPALAPLSEIMNNISKDQNDLYLFDGSADKYDYGFKAAKEVIKSQISG